MDEDDPLPRKNPRRNVPPVPTTRAELLAQSGSKPKTLIDHIQDVFLEHIGDDVIQLYLEPLTDEESITGKLEYDAVKLAERIQELAKTMGLAPVYEVKLDTVITKMRWAQRRMELRPNQRIEKAGGDLRDDGDLDETHGFGTDLD